MYDDLDFKKMALDKCDRVCKTITANYEKLYDEDDNRDRLFMKELVDTILQVEILTSVYLRDGEIHPNYALEKLEIMKSQVDSQIRYWKAKGEEKQNGD